MVKFSDMSVLLQPPEKYKRKKMELEKGGREEGKERREREAEEKILE